MAEIESELKGVLEIYEMTASGPSDNMEGSAYLDDRQREIRFISPEQIRLVLEDISDQAVNE